MTPTTPTSWGAFSALVLAAAVGMFGGAAVVADRAEPLAEADATSPLCLDADRTRVAQLIGILERNRPADEPVLERAVSGLNLARLHCVSGWNEVAGELYEWLGQWLDDHR